MLPNLFIPPITIEGIPTATHGKYLGCLLTQTNLQDLEVRRCRRSLFGRYNSLLRHSTGLRYFSDDCKRQVISSYGLPHGIETLPRVNSTITAPHRFMTMNLWPQAYSIKDANGITIKSRNL